METIIDGRSVKPTAAQTRAVLIGAGVMLSLSMGMRQSLGLFMLPITRDLHLSVADFTFALAVQNIAWGVSQPFIGAFADKYGCRPVTMAGTIVFALGIFFMMTATGAFGVMLGAGVLMGVALSCIASNLAMTASARAVSPQTRMMALGVMSAVGSLGTFLAAPFAQTIIADHGWHAALLGFLMFCGIMLPAAFFVGSADKIAKANARAGGGVSFGESPSLISVLRDASHHRGYITMATAFFVCGLQLVFLTTHLPTYLALCGQDPMLSAEALSTIGMFNVVGCYVLGWAGGRYPKHILLGLVYVLRSLAITAYFLMPATTTSTLIFSAIMGLLWLGVAPLVNGLVAQMFGLRYMATLTGMAFFVHQLGSFLGAWGGGLIYDALGSYDRAWQFGVVIGLVAGVAQMMASDRPRPQVLRPAVA
ncbi:MAG: major Facilitator Superfamily protein [Rhodospirillales bacterium]|nr:major Facilitator Superfamily protein [Rhodospirillales bacterium]